MLKALKGHFKYPVKLHGIAIQAKFATHVRWSVLPSPDFSTAIVLVDEHGENGNDVFSLIVWNLSIDECLFNKGTIVQRMDNQMSSLSAKPSLGQKQIGQMGLLKTLTSQERVNCWKYKMIICFLNLLFYSTVIVRSLSLPSYVENETVATVILHELRDGVSKGDTIIVDVERQKKLNNWLSTLYDRQERINETKHVVVFHLHDGGGFGNVIRGYISSMVLVVLFDAAFKGIHVV